MQSDGFKRAWAKALRSMEWGAPVCADICARGQLAEGDVKGVDAKTAQTLVSDEEIIDAYAKGEEEFGIYCLKCVGYDITWQKYLHKTYPIHLAIQAAKKTKKAPAKKASFLGVSDRTSVGAKAQIAK
ncbi:unnamed protein product [Somion occarium]|uniref:DUF6697 domain-containing protein n=1 Tax=Somion occarium TaxID=3059160 RepID=A0ABP1CM84_9APHY